MRFFDFWQMIGDLAESEVLDEMHSQMADHLQNAGQLWSEYGKAEQKDIENGYRLKFGLGVV